MKLIKVEPTETELNALVVYLFRKGFSKRQIKVLEQLVQGKTNPDIALALGRTETTVKYHMGCIFTKLGLTSRKEVLNWMLAIELPIAPPPPIVLSIADEQQVAPTSTLGDRLPSGLHNS